jgi:methyl-accepting chemotaxis protein
MPNLSIATKLYMIFALLASATVALAGIALVNARHHAAMTSEYETSLSGTRNVEKVNGLVYAVVMESRGVYMSSDIPTAKRYGDLLLKFNDRIAAVVQDWRKNLRGDDAAQFEEFSKRTAQLSSSAGSWRGLAPR